jgi:hypothetical protein
MYRIQDTYLPDVVQLLPPHQPHCLCKRNHLHIKGYKRDMAYFLAIRPERSRVLGGAVEGQVFNKFCILKIPALRLRSTEDHGLTPLSAKISF